MIEHMNKPKYSNFLYIYSTIIAVLCVIVGVFMVFAGLISNKNEGDVLLFGVAMIASSIAGLGIIYCFISLVHASIDTRNILADMNNRAIRAEQGQATSQVSDS